MLSKIHFGHYKAFPEMEEIELRPITLVIGKNSSGKSSILKLLPMLGGMLSGKIDFPMLLHNRGISVATVYEDLLYKRDTSGLRLGVEYDDGTFVSGSYLVKDGKIGIYLYEAAVRGERITTQCDEDGTGLNGLVYYEILEKLGIDPQSLNFKWNYIGPIRALAPHAVFFQGFDNTLSIGYCGTEAYQLLLNSYLSDKQLFTHVSDWMHQNLEGQQLEFSNTNNNFGTYSLTVRHDGYQSNVTGVGQGVSQVLPVITQSFVAAPGSVNIIEQPALHLHPAAHSCVAYRLGQSAKERGCKYLIESHSENLLLGFRHMIVNPDVDFCADDIVVYYITEAEKGSTLQRIDINENGDFSDWPTGVFSEGFELLRAIMQMRR